MIRKAVIFDFGDTLFRINSFDFQKGQQALAHLLGKTSRLHELEEAQEAIRYLFDQREGTNLEVDLQKFLRLSIEVAGWTTALSGFVLELEFWRAAAGLELFPHVAEALAALKTEENVSLGIITNAAFSEDLNRVPLRESGIEHFFDAVISSCDYGVRKPARFLFDVALNRLGVDRSHAIYVGNSIEFDIDGAKNAGLKSVLFDPEGDHEDFQGARFSNYRELPLIVEQLLSTSSFSS